MDPGGTGCGGLPPCADCKIIVIDQNSRVGGYNQGTLHSEFMFPNPEPGSGACLGNHQRPITADPGPFAGIGGAVGQRAGAGGPVEMAGIRVRGRSPGPEHLHLVPGQGRVHLGGHRDGAAPVRWAVLPGVQAPGWASEQRDPGPPGASRRDALGGHLPGPGPQRRRSVRDRAGWPARSDGAHHGPGGGTRRPSPCGNRQGALPANRGGPVRGRALVAWGCGSGPCLTAGGRGGGRLLLGWSPGPGFQDGRRRLDGAAGPRRIWKTPPPRAGGGRNGKALGPFAGGPLGLREGGVRASTVPREPHERRCEPPRGRTGAALDTRHQRVGVAGQGGCPEDGREGGLAGGARNHRPDGPGRRPLGWRTGASAGQGPPVLAQPGRGERPGRYLRLEPHAGPVRDAGRGDPAGHGPAGARGLADGSRNRGHPGPVRGPGA